VGELVFLRGKQPDNTRIVGNLDALCPQFSPSPSTMVAVDDLPGVVNLHWHEDPVYGDVGLEGAVLVLGQGRQDLVTLRGAEGGLLARSV
jgi:hypothetical protein